MPYGQSFALAVVLSHKMRSCIAQVDRHKRQIGMLRCRRGSITDHVRRWCLCQRQKKHLKRRCPSIDAPRHQAGPSIDLQFVVFRVRSCPKIRIVRKRVPPDQNFCINHSPTDTFNEPGVSRQDRLEKVRSCGRHNHVQRPRLNIYLNGARLQG